MGQGKLHEPTDEQRQQVIHWSGMGCTQGFMSKQLGITEDTLAKHYRHELDQGVEYANTAVAGSLFKKAISDDHPQAATAAMFWLKTRARWRETQVHEHEHKMVVEIEIGSGDFDRIERTAKLANPNLEIEGECEEAVPAIPEEN